MGHALVLQVLSKHELQHSWELCYTKCIFLNEIICDSSI